MSTHQKIQQALNSVAQVVEASHDKRFVKKLQNACKMDIQNPWFCLATVSFILVAGLGPLFVHALYPENKQALWCLIGFFATTAIAVPLGVMGYYRKTIQKAQKIFLWKNPEDLYQCKNTLGGIFEPPTQQTKLRVIEKIKQIDNNMLSDFWPLVGRCNIPNGWWHTIEQLCDEQLASQANEINESVAIERLSALQLEEDIEISAAAPHHQHMKV